MSENNSDSKIVKFSGKIKFKTESGYQADEGYNSDRVIGTEDAAGKAKRAAFAMLGRLVRMLVIAGFATELAAFVKKEIAETKEVMSPRKTR